MKRGRVIVKINHRGMEAWVGEMARWCTPDSIHWCDGSQAEYDRILEGTVQSRSAVRLHPERRPASYLFRSDPSDVARVEDRTFICTHNRDDAGPNNNWADPDETRAAMRTAYEGCMRGRTLYVIPYSMGPIGSPLSNIGVELTDSPYVAANMHIMTRVGTRVLEQLGSQGAFVRGLHSVGAPLAPGQVDRPWPCNPDVNQKYITHFPETREIWSYGSGYGGNALLGKKCHALRIASVQARDEGWLAEHMVIFRLTTPAGKTYHVAGALPSACGKTNLAMMQPSLPGWKVETIGDDICWMKFGPDGRLYAINAETGFFGVAPGTSLRSNPNAMHTLRKECIFTNCLLTPDGDVWWEEMDGAPPPQGLDWQGREWTPESGRKGAHPNARFTAPARLCPVIAPDWDDPRGVPIDIILFGGRRSTTVPLVTEARSWQHGVFLGSIMGSELTAAAFGVLGSLRRDPMAMLPFCGYHMGDYLAHWLRMGERTTSDKLPRLFYVNWFRRSGDHRWLWPGFGDNSRVLKWMVERIEGRADGEETPIGTVPTMSAMDLGGLHFDADDFRQLMRVDPHEWREELDNIERHFRQFGDRMPSRLIEELAALRRSLAPGN